MYPIKIPVSIIITGCPEGMRIHEAHAIITEEALRELSNHRHDYMDGGTLRTTTDGYTGTANDGYPIP